jgi:SAM-dependent methyltransferase
MPTIPPALSDEEIQRLREKAAVSFGTDAERYDRSRPRYPDALVSRIVAAAPGREACQVLDVGCGTGIVARQFQAAGCQVFGIDPDERMADLARQFGIEVEIAKIEDWDPADRQFDAVVAGQVWHWVDPVAGAAKAAQALRPDGLLAIFWNAFQPPPELAEAFGAVFQRVAPTLPFTMNWTRPAVEGYTDLCTRAAGAIREVGEFGEPEQWRFDWEHPYSQDDYLDQLPTTGALTQAPPEVVAEVLAGVGAAIDAVGGSFSMSCSTVAVAAARRGT